MRYRVPSSLIVVALLAGGISCAIWKTPAGHETLDVRGRLVVASTGQPFYGFGNTGGIGVNIWDSSGAGTSRLIESDELEPDGGFVLVDIPTTTKELEFCSNIIQARKIRVDIDPDGGSTSGVVDIGDVPPRIENIIRILVIGPDGNAVKRAQVRLTQIEPSARDRASTTNEKGEITFGGFAAGPATLTGHAFGDRGNEWVENLVCDPVKTVKCVVEDALITQVVLQFTKEDGIPKS